MQGIPEHGAEGWELVDFVRYRDDRDLDVGRAEYEHPSGAKATVVRGHGPAPEDSALPRGPW